MGLKKDFTLEERGKIAAFSLAGWIVTLIAKLIKRRKTEVRIYLESAVTTQIKQKYTGRKPKVTPLLQRYLQNKAIKRTISTRELCQRINDNVRCKNIFSEITQKGFFFCKAIFNPMLTADKKQTA